MRYFVLIFISLFLFPSYLYSQNDVTLTLPEDTAMMGEDVYLPVTVENFTDIIAFQFSISYDSLVLEIEDMSDFSLDYLTLNNFGFPPDLPKGIITVAWYDEELQPRSLNDGDTLFVMRFKVIGQPGAWSPVAITGTPAAIEIGDANGSPLPYILDSGSVYVQPGVGTFSLNNPAFTYLPLSPNPMTEVSYLHFELYKAMDMQWRVIDAGGKVVVEGNAHLPSGKHHIPLYRNQLPSAGTYIVELMGENYHGARTLIVTH